MTRKPKQNEIVHVQRPEDVPSQPPMPIQPGQVYYDPNTGQYVQAIQPGQGSMQQQSPTTLLPPGVDERTGGIGFEGRILIRQNADGSETSMLDGRIQSVRHSPPPAEGTEYIPNAMSKKRMFIGSALAILVVMILSDVVGIPHVRTGEGEYASLEGVKRVDNPDAPLVILKRLDRSVFLYAFDGIGWIFSVLGGSDNAPETRSLSPAV